MGLSVAISGGIILTVFVLILLSLPGFVDKMFSIGDTSSQVSAFDRKITNTDISLESLFAASGSPYVNFTLNNDNREKLWNFEKFNVMIRYDGASGVLVEELSYVGNCNGGVPSVGSWCIETIAGDFLDVGILNDGESAKIVTHVSQNLVSQNAFVTVSTDNGVVAKLPAPKRSWFDVGPIPPAKCEFETYGRSYVDTDTGISYICDPTRDKWLSSEVVILFGEQSGGCPNGADLSTNQNCGVEWGNGMGQDGVPPQIGLFLPYNMTVVAYGFSEDDDDCGGTFDLQIWGSGSNLSDEGYTLQAEFATGLTGEAENSQNVNVDIPRDQYINWGIENNCGGGNTIDDFNIVLYFKWRHDNP